MMKKCAACLAVLACIVSGANAADMGHSMGDFSLSGYVDGEFTAQQRPNAADPNDTGWKSSFGDDSHAVLWATSDPSQKASFLTEVYYWQATNSFTLQQAAVDWHLYSTDAYMVTGRIGKFYYPFGIEGRSQHATTNMLVSRPFVRNAAGTRIGVLRSTPDNGVELMGGGKMGESNVRMNWAFAVTNGPRGSGLAPQLMDADKNKGVGGQLGWMFMDHYELGGSAQFGKYNGTDNYLLVGAHGVAMPAEGFDLRGEWAMSQADNALGGTPDRKAMTFYGQAAWTMPLEGENMKSFGLAARFAWLDPNTASASTNDDASQLALGANFSPADRLNLKLEFDLNMQNVTGTEPDDNAVLAQAVVGW